jgi:ElaB/YqjD/DUF883 family membrane-anchored ribosome-binding protein
MESRNDVATDKGELRVQLENGIAKAKEVCDRLQEQTTSAARATDKTIREHPYHAVGVAFGIGVFLGLLAMWSRRD